MSEDVAIPIGSVIGRLVIRVRFVGMVPARIRFWIASQLMKLGAAVAGTLIEISVGNDADPMGHDELPASQDRGTEKV